MSESKIPFFSTLREFSTHQTEIMTRIEQAFHSGYVLLGNPVAEFENKVATLVGRAHGVAVNSCTDALYFALRAAGIHPGDEILVTDLSFIASASGIKRLGAVPIFVDVDENYNMDLEKASALVTPKTRAIICVHLYGQMMNPVQMEQFARTYNLILIEDAAQSFGASFNDRPAGSVGLMSCFSFDPAKTISAPGSGGMVLTDDVLLADQIRRLRYHGMDSNGTFVEVGYNSQMSTLTAAVLDYKLDHNTRWIAHRRQIAHYYLDRLSELDMVMPLEQATSKHNYHKFVIRSGFRNALKLYLAQRNIQTFIHYSKPLHQQPCFSDIYYNDTFYPNTLQFCDSILSLPIHPFLSDQEVEFIADAVRAFYEQRSYAVGHS